MSDLAPFNASARCPKCDHSEVAAHYRPPEEKDHGWYERRYHLRFPESELIQRRCERCGFLWAEGCLKP